ncbi:hypothetical protein LCGC14_1618920 [marine sediment metagenome]|uniref:Uncharacterized protein n=1 Tax=marine sediment metagenome TaxID=412755 RepID=A0A0F9L613_9ZZZZ
MYLFTTLKNPAARHGFWLRLMGLYETQKILSLTLQSRIPKK